MKKMKKYLSRKLKIVQPISLAIIKEPKSQKLKHTFKVGDCVRVLEQLEYNSPPLITHCCKDNIHQYIFTEDLLLC